MNVLFPAHHPNMVLVKKFNKMLATPDKLICILEVKNGDIYTPDSIIKNPGADPGRARAARL